MTNTESICEIFSIFHDGMIESAELCGQKLKLKVKIPYLAERIKMGFKFFFVELEGFRRAEFRGWPATLQGEKKLVTEFSAIFESALEILEAKLTDGRIEVVCNIKSDADSEFCGGELLFSADAATVRDEANKDYSISELGEICKAYWSEWKANNAKRI